MKALSTVCAPLVAAAMLALAAPTLAQQPAKPAPPSTVLPSTVLVGPPRDEIGRYQLLSLPPGSTGQAPLAILLDTQYGRTWSLFAQPDGSTVWKRNLVQRYGNLPQNHLSRPGPGSQ